jgi:aspartate aminotransferase-like enzyme
VAAYCDALRGHDALIILDGVCATGGIDERFDAWGLDVVLTAPQKAIGAPPGLALCVFSPRAVEKRRRLRRVPAFYADLNRWLPVMEEPGRYFSTHAVNEIVALAEAFAMIGEEGLERRFARHAWLADAFRTGLDAVGISLFTQPSCRADTLSVPLLPPGVDDLAFRRRLAERGVVVAGGLGPIAGKAFRVGHMGNIGAAEIATTLVAIEASLAECGWKVIPGAALAASAPALSAAASGVLDGPGGG